MFQELLLTKEEFSFQKYDKGHWKDINNNILFQHENNKWSFQFYPKKLEALTLEGQVEAKNLESQSFSTLTVAKTVAFQFLETHNLKFERKLTRTVISRYTFCPTYLIKQQKPIYYLGQIVSINGKWNYVITAQTVLETFKNLEGINLTYLHSSFKTRREIVDMLLSVVNDYLPQLYEMSYADKNSKNLWWTNFLRPEIELKNIFGN